MRFCPVQASGHPVQVDEAGVDSGDLASVFRRLFDFLVSLRGEIAGRLEPAADFPGCDRKHLRFRSFQDLSRSLFASVAPRHQFVPELDQLPGCRLLPHGLRVMGRVG